MKLRISSTLGIDEEEAWSLAKKTSTLRHVSKGLVGFAKAEKLPEEWRVGARWRLRTFVLGIPAGIHEIHFTTLDKVDREMVSVESGGLIRSMEHRVLIEPIDEETSRFTEEVDIDAGAMTPLVGRLVWLFYKYRHARLRGLVQKNKSSQQETGPERASLDT